MRGDVGILHPQVSKGSFVVLGCWWLSKDSAGHAAGSNPHFHPEGMRVNKSCVKIYEHSGIP